MMHIPHTFPPARPHARTPARPHPHPHPHLLDVGYGILVLCPAVSVVRLCVHKNVDDGREGEDVGNEAGHHQPVAYSALEYPDLSSGFVCAHVDFEAGTDTCADTDADTGAGTGTDQQDSEMRRDVEVPIVRHAARISATGRRRRRAGSQCETGRHHCAAHRSVFLEGATHEKKKLVFPSVEI